MSLKPLWLFLQDSIREFNRDNCTHMAAAIAYYALFSVVPLTVFLVSVFGFFVRNENLREDVTAKVVDFIGLQQGDPTLQLDRQRITERYGADGLARLQTALDVISQDEKDRAVAGLTAKPSRTVTVAGLVLDAKDIKVRYKNNVSDTLRQVAQINAALTVVGLLGMAWAASAMFGAVRKALNVAWGVEQHLPFVQQKLKDLAMVVGLGFLLVVSVVGTAALRALRAISDEALGPLSTGTGFFWSLLPYALPFVFTFAVFALLYRFVPAAKVRFREVWPAALVAAILFEVMKDGFAFYVARFNAYDLLYGSLGGILLFLSGAYLSAIILLLGAELAAGLPRYRAGEFRVVSTGPRQPFVVRARADVYRFVRDLFFHQQ